MPSFVTAVRAVRTVRPTVRPLRRRAHAELHVALAERQPLVAHGDIAEHHHLRVRLEPEAHHRDEAGGAGRKLDEPASVRANRHDPIRLTVNGADYLLSDGTTPRHAYRLAALNDHVVSVDVRHGKCRFLGRRGDKDGTRRQNPNKRTHKHPPAHGQKSFHIHKSIIPKGSVADNSPNG